jgi:hypothetical protein
VRRRTVVEQRRRQQGSADHRFTVVCRRDPYYFQLEMEVIGIFPDNDDGGGFMAAATMAMVALKKKTTTFVGREGRR